LTIWSRSKAGIDASGYGDGAVTDRQLRSWQNLSMMRVRVSALLATVMLVSGGGCASTTSTQSTDPTTCGVVDDSAVDTTAPPTSEPSSSAVPSPTDGTPTTTPDTTAPPETGVTSTVSVPPPGTEDPLPSLRSTGIGEAEFGDPFADTVAYLAAVLGAPSSQTPQEFPSDPGDGSFQTIDGEFGFIAPYGSTVCFLNSLCVVFGGRSQAALTFVGWEYGAPSTPPLTTSAGVGLDARWSDVGDSLDVPPGGCFAVGFGTTDGAINVQLLSTGEPFSYFDEATSTFVEAVPSDRSQVTITSMSAGSLVAALFSDC
jgi:hypothetical protein